MIDSVLFIANAVSAFVWLLLLCMPSRWCMGERWESAGYFYANVSKWPSLSVIVPARNESASLPTTLPSWLAQDYPEAEIILVDDNSNDFTSECAGDIAVRSNRIVRVLSGSRPPMNWTGKLWALQQGVNASSSDWLLFTDADIYHNPNLWRGLVAKAISERRSMVSLMALLDTRGRWASLLIPAFVYFFHILYPFGKVREPHSGISAAAGGCILISRCALDTIGGISGYSHAWIDDLALAKRVKGAGLSVSLSLTKSAVSIRPYSCLCDIWQMVARNAFSQLKYSWIALVGTVVGMLILFLLPVMGVCMYPFFPVSLAAALLSFTALALMAVTYIPILRFFGMTIVRSFTLPIAGILYLAMTLTSAVNYVKGKREWRGARIDVSL